jgi:hypothetical protein
MTRQDMIDKLLGWYEAWLRQDGFAEYDPTHATEMKDDKRKRLNLMSDEALKDLYVQQLIRKESYAKDES